MTREQNILRALVIYGLTLPLAIYLGYLMGNPLQSRALMTIVFVLLVLTAPIILRFHHPLLFLSWNMTAVLPLPGRPQFWLAMVATGLTISIIQYALTRRLQFARSPSILWPMLFLAAVVLATAMLTGGMGMRIMGSQLIGGRKYLIFFAGILGYLAMTAHQVPPRQANIYLGLFLLGTVANGIGNLLPWVPKSLYPIFMFFPVETQGVNAVLGSEAVASSAPTIGRFTQASGGLVAVAFFFLARYGITGLLNFKKPALWIFLAASIISMFGGFRSKLIFLVMVAVILFFLEGHHKTRLLPVTCIVGLLMGSLLIGFSQHLPLALQRSLSWIPIVEVDPVVKLDVEGSNEWRLNMWRDLWKRTPDYLLVGKGLLVSAADLETADTLAKQGRGDTADVAMLAGDYHSGPLSILITFGMWGAIGWIWFIAIGIRSLYLNYQYGAPEFRRINSFLLAYFIARVILFHAVVGQFDKHFMEFAGILGFSVALNNGIRKPAPAKDSTEQAAAHGPFSRPRLIPSFSRLTHR